MIVKSDLEQELKVNDIKRRIKCFKEFAEDYVLTDDEKKKWQKLLSKNVFFDPTISIVREYQDAEKYSGLSKRSKADIRKCFVDQIKQVLFIIVV